MSRDTRVRHTPSGRLGYVEGATGGGWLWVLFDDCAEPQPQHPDDLEEL